MARHWVSTGSNRIPVPSKPLHLVEPEPHTTANHDRSDIGIGTQGSSTRVKAPYTLDQIAAYLTNGYWDFNGENWRAFDVRSDGRTITYDTSRLSDGGQIIAEHAMNMWGAVTGATFQGASRRLTTYTEGNSDYANQRKGALVLNGPNAIIDGAISSNGDRDVFQVSLQAGVTYSLSMARFGKLDAIVEIWNSAGTPIGRADSNIAAAGEYLEFTPTTSGPYFLVADGYGSTTGAYEFSIQVAADLTFNDADTTGAYAISDITGNRIDHSYINIPDNWDALNLNGFMLQTYIHEIGHALGLGHAGPYDGKAVWGKHNLYDNDSWSSSIMSYFDQQANPNDPNSWAFLATMMPADIIAIQNLYGSGSAGFETGDTVWGPGGNLDSDYFQQMLDMWGGLTPANPFVFGGESFAFTIYDTAGSDTLDFSSFGQNQSINLNQLERSNIAGLVGNVVIARGTVIENAIGGRGKDTINGNSADNFLRGMAGNDSLYGGAGDDRLQGGAGRDRLEGGAGRDIADYTDATAAVSVDLLTPASNTGFAAGDTYSSIENLSGSAYNDSLYGDAAANVLRGHNGNDFLFGRSGNDTLYGMNGNDRLQGGDGADRIDGGSGQDAADYTDASASVTVNLTTPKNNTGIAAGDSFYSVEDLYGSAFNDLLTGDAAANLLRGYNGHDRLSGVNGNDALYGMNGNDSLYGGNGNDRLSGGAGQDRLEGGEGADSFLFDFALGSANVDHIADFKPVDDTILLSDDIFANLRAGALASSALTFGNTAASAATRIIYHQSTGQLYYDPNGNASGGQVLFATLTAGTVLTAADFEVV